MSPHEGQPVEWAGAPLGASPVVIIAVHGRNAAPRNILDLVARLERPGVTAVAPAAANHTWYPYSFLAPTEENEPGLSSGLGVLAALVDDLVAQGTRRERIVLLGFSQGACLASEFAARHPARYGGLIAFSGGLIGPPGTAWPESGTLDGTRVFLGCSDVDSHVPRARVEDSAGVFTRLGAAVTLRIYPGMGHLVCDDELDHARAIVDDLLAAG